VDREYLLELDSLWWQMTERGVCGTAIQWERRWIVSIYWNWIVCG